MSLGTWFYVSDSSRWYDAVVKSRSTKEVAGGVCWSYVLRAIKSISVRHRRLDSGVKDIDGVSTMLKSVGARLVLVVIVFVTRSTDLRVIANRTCRDGRRVLAWVL
jgi:hypothetical protein